MVTVFKLQGTELGDGKGCTCHSGIKGVGPQARCPPEARGEEESKTTAGLAPRGPGEWGCQLLVQQNFWSPLCKALVLHSEKERDGEQVTCKSLNTPAAKGSLEEKSSWSPVGGLKQDL